MAADRSRRRRSGARVVAITGVHGIPGARLLRRLDEDDQVSRVVLLDRHAPALPLRKGVGVVVDLTATFADAAIAEALARERVQTVLHAAFHRAPVHALEGAHELEVIGTRTLLHAVAHNARHAGTVESVVVLGTTMSYGAMPDNPQYVRETAPLRGGLGYPFVADKVAVEHEVAAFRRRTGIATTMLRSAWIVGELDSLAARMFAPLLVPAVLGADPLMQLVHVDDLVDAVRLAVHAAHDGTYNVAGAGVLPLSTVIKRVGRMRAPAPESAVRAALNAQWVAGVGTVPGAHTAYLRDTCVADTAHARDALRFRPRYAIRDAIVHHVATRRGSARPAA